jgi:hypothetical protein
VVLVHIDKTQLLLGLILANSSLVLLDYLRNTRYGKGLPNDAFETNYDSFKTSANTCDTQVTPYSGATSDINLFETNAVIDSEKKY